MRVHRTRSQRVASAFTFIEVLAVVVLLGLLAGATAWSLAGDARRADRRNVIEQLAHADAMARLAAERFGRPVTLRIDLDHQRITRIVTVDANTEETGHAVRLPDEVRLTAVRIAAGPDPLPGRRTGLRTGEFDAGVVNIPFSDAGRSATYAVRIEARDPETDRARATWLTIAGLSGQTMEIHDPETVDNLFAALDARPDAD